MKVLFLVLFTLLFISCSKKDTQVNKTNAQKKYKTPNKAFQKPIPNWVMNPNIGVKYGAVGIAPYQKNKKLQKLSAIANGKRKLSQQFRMQLQNQLTPSFNTNQKLMGSTFNIVALQSSQNITKNATIKAQYIDARGTLYLWIVIY